MQSKSRSTFINTLKENRYDILVIGGGATGAGIALDAASRGLKTALIEKQDFSSGTSSRSTKLIHGGLRYLKQLDFGLVRETGTERAVLHKLAPHLVLPEKMILPLVKGGTYGKWSTSFGLKVYDILAGVEGDDRRKMLSKKATLQLEPLLNEDTLKGSGFYAEYRTDDSRLTIELIKMATQYGALCLNYLKAADFEYENDKITAVKCKDQLNGEMLTIEAKEIVAAGGPWVDQLRKKDNSLKGKRLRHTKGVHVVVPREKFPIDYTVYFDVPDGRMLFAVPRGRVTYIGTTDTEYTGDLDRIVATKKDAEYILGSVASAFPSIRLEMKNVISNWAGVRPLIHEDGKSPSELSRKDEIFESDSGLIAIAGGKLTGYRKMAQRIVDIVCKRLANDKSIQIKSCQTKSIPLTPNPLSNSELKRLILDLEAKVKGYGLDPYFAWYLVTNYGRVGATILDNISLYKNDPEVAITRSELAYCIDNELVYTLADFYIRRTGRLFFEIKNIALTKSFILDDFATYFGWSADEKANQDAAFEQDYSDATTFYEQEFV